VKIRSVVSAECDHMNKKGPPNDQRHEITKHVIFPLLFLFASSTACTTVQAVMRSNK